MHFLIIVLALMSCAVAIFVRTESKPVYLIALSANIIISFIIVMFMRGTEAAAFAMFLFLADVIITPWVTFMRLQKGVPVRVKKDPKDKKDWRKILRGDEYR